MPLVADKYEVRGVLGEGGTGIVYDAIRTSDGASVALKVMHEALAGDRQIRGRFQREAAILRRLEGDHVCAILDFGEMPGGKSGASLLYIAMPKVVGESLAQVLLRGPIPVDRALDVMLAVLAALRSAHAQGVIHRDLKPANVLIDEAGKIIVVDFGMSKIITGQGGAPGATGTTNLTAHNMLFGTPEYMSPEQARGDELDARCDVYAAGVMLYELLTGEPPFTEATPLAVLTAHLTSVLVPPTERKGGKGRITPALEAVVIHALARERDLRYGSAAALSAAIVHARTAPEDLAAVAPGPSPNGAPAPPDALAATLPGDSLAPVLEVKGFQASTLDAQPVDVSAATMLSAAPQRIATEPPSSKAVRPPSDKPPVRATPRAHEDEAGSNRLWILLWIVVVVVSIAAGVWLALRS